LHANTLKDGPSLLLQPPTNFPVLQAFVFWWDKSFLRIRLARAYRRGPSSFPKRRNSDPLFRRRRRPAFVGSFFFHEFHFFTTTSAKVPFPSFSLLAFAAQSGLKSTPLLSPTTFFEIVRNLRQFPHRPGLIRPGPLSFRRTSHPLSWGVNICAEKSQTASQGRAAAKIPQRVEP